MGIHLSEIGSAALQLESLQNIRCPCCESDRARHSFEKDEVDYYACASCGLTFVFPRPGEKTLQEHYEDYGWRYYSLDGLKDFLLSAKHYRRELRLLRQTKKAGKLLDVGCSVGGFVKAAAELGYDAEGIDISAASAAVGQKAGLKIRAADFLRRDFPDKFDVITLWATLEHLPEPNRYVARAGELLRPGGVLLGSVPNYSGITQRLISKKDRYVGPDHLNYWTALGFADYVARFGFEILETVTFGFNPIAIAQDWASGGKHVGCEQMAVDQKRSARWKDTWLGHVHRAIEKVLNVWSLGDAVAVAARLGG
jgi:2-polyprenyl-3-methyl-5-hydroxy-6-metoxy-1,4-benzoquinol methylase